MCSLAENSLEFSAEAMALECSFGSLKQDLTFSPVPVLPATWEKARDINSKMVNPGMAMYTWNRSLSEAKVGGLQVQGQPELHRKALSLNK